MCRKCSQEKPESDFYHYPEQTFRRCKACCYAVQRIRNEAKRKPRKAKADRFWEKVDRSADGCWPFRGAIDQRGYGRFSVRNVSVPAHRVAWELSNGPIRSGLHVLHSCDNPPCCNPSHLRLGTNAENHTEKIAKGRHKYRVTPDVERAIRVLLILGMSKVAVSKRLGIGISSVYVALGAA